MVSVAQVITYIFFFLKLLDQKDFAIVIHFMKTRMVTIMVGWKTEKHCNIDNFIDKNECSLGTYNCNRKRTYCVNTIGSYTCRCRSNYRWNGVSCLGTKYTKIR